MVYRDKLQISNVCDARTDILDTSNWDNDSSWIWEQAFFNDFASGMSLTEYEETTARKTGVGPYTVHYDGWGSMAVQTMGNAGTWQMLECDAVGVVTANQAVVGSSLIGVRGAWNDNFDWKGNEYGSGRVHFDASNLLTKEMTKKPEFPADLAHKPNDRITNYSGTEIYDNEKDYPSIELDLGITFFKPIDVTKNKLYYRYAVRWRGITDAHWIFEQMEFVDHGPSRNCIYYESEDVEVEDEADKLSEAAESVRILRNIARWSFDRMFYDCKMYVSQNEHRGQKHRNIRGTIFDMIGTSKNQKIRYNETVIIDENTIGWLTQSQYIAIVRGSYLLKYRIEEVVVVNGIVKSIKIVKYGQDRDTSVAVLSTPRWSRSDQFIEDGLGFHPAYLRN